MVWEGLGGVLRAFLIDMSKYFNTFWLNLHVPPWIAVMVISFLLAWWINSKAKIRFMTFVMSALFYAAFAYMGFGVTS